MLKSYFHLCLLFSDSKNQLFSQCKAMIAFKLQDNSCQKISVLLFKDGMLSIVDSGYLVRVILHVRNRILTLLMSSHNQVMLDVGDTDVISIASFRRALLHAERSNVADS